MGWRFSVYSTDKPDMVIKPDIPQGTEQVPHG